MLIIRFVPLSRWLPLDKTSRVLIVKLNKVEKYLSDKRSVCGQVRYKCSKLSPVCKKVEGNILQKQQSGLTLVLKRERHKFKMCLELQWNRANSFRSNGRKDNVHKLMKSILHFKSKGPTVRLFVTIISWNSAKAFARELGINDLKTLAGGFFLKRKLNDLGRGGWVGMMGNGGRLFLTNEYNLKYSLYVRLTENFVPISAAVRIRLFAKLKRAAIVVLSS